MTNTARMMATTATSALNAAISPRPYRLPFIVHPFLLSTTGQCGMVRLPVRLFHRPPNEPPPEPPDDPPKPPPEKEPPEPPKLPEPPDEEDGAAAEIVLRTSAKLELSCAPRSPKFALNAAGSIVEAPSDVPTDAQAGCWNARACTCMRCRHAHPTTADRHFGICSG